MCPSAEQKRPRQKHGDGGPVIDQRQHSGLPQGPLRQVTIQTPPVPVWGTLIRARQRPPSTQPRRRQASHRGHATSLSRFKTQSLTAASLTEEKPLSATASPSAPRYGPGEGRHTPSKDSGKGPQISKERSETTGPTEGPTRHHTSEADAGTVTPSGAPRRGRTGCSLPSPRSISSIHAPSFGPAAAGRKESPYLLLALRSAEAAPRFPNRHRWNSGSAGGGVPVVLSNGPAARTVSFPASVGACSSAARE